MAPAAELLVDERLVRRLLSEQFPELASASVCFLAEGWDVTVWVVDYRWAFRFPRRAAVVSGFERELEVLPGLAPLLPLAIPAPRFRGRASAAFPWPFFGAPLIPGREALEAGLDERARTELAVPLAEFLAALHRPAVLEAISATRALPADPNGRADMATRVPLTREALDEVARLGLWEAPSSTDVLLAGALRLRPSRPNALTHGDLHVRQLLVADARLTGVIDWIDVCHGDRAIDLHLLWSFVPADARDTFLAAYGPVSAEELLRARVLALFLSATLALHGHREGLADLEREALHGLRRAAAG
jgi:aminoglycoside phosphotransferase (APT) family kinase protein